MLKKLLSVLLIASLCLGIMPSAFANEQPISVELNGKPIQFDTEPVIINDRVMVPIRAIIEGVGAKVDWDGDAQKVTAVLGDTNVSFVIGEDKALKNGAFTDMYGGAMLIGGRSLVSARFVGEAFGLDVNWDEAARKVTIGKAKIPDLGKAYNIVSITADAQDGNPAVQAFDDNYQTRWSHDVNGAELVIELEDIVPIGYMGIACYLGDERNTIVAFDVSDDGTSWTEVVSKTLTTSSLAMEPISFGEDCKAKYVRLRGYGNTNNEWTSITELKVYAPQPDGSMPVDMNAPVGGASADAQSLPPEVQNAIGEVEQYFDNVIGWLSHMYDSETGGFYMAASGRDDPNFAPSLEVTAWGLSILRGYTNVRWNDMPEDIKEKFIKFFQERQDPETGYFLDRQANGVNARDNARANSATLGALSSLKAEPLYPHPSQATLTEEETEKAETVLPDYMSSTSAYVAYIDSLNWATDSWSNGDKLQSSLTYINMLPEAQAEEYKRVLFDWVETHQDPVTGLWGNSINYNSVSGAFKMGLTYAACGRQLPNPEKIIESVFECYATEVPSTVYFVRNPLSVLNQMKTYSPEIDNMIKQGVLDNIDNIAASFARYATPDGGFCAYHRRALTTFSGIQTNHGLWESDIDAVLMAIIARSAIYSIFDVQTPKLDASIFWDWIKGEIEKPPFYEDESFVEENGSKMSLDFEKYDTNAKYIGNEFGGVEVNGALKVAVVDDVDRRDNKSLKLSYDGSAAAGPNIEIMGDGAQIKYTPYTKTITEFKLKFANATATNNFYIDFGTGIAYALSFGGNGGQKVGSRVSTTSVNYGGAFTTLNPNEWYNIRVEFEVNEDVTDATAKVYVDGELVSKNNNYYGCTTGVSPKLMSNKLTVYFYKAGVADVYFDDIVMYNE